MINVFSKESFPMESQSRGCGHKKFSGGFGPRSPQAPCYFSAPSSQKVPYGPRIDIRKCKYIFWEVKFLDQLPFCNSKIWLCCTRASIPPDPLDSCASAICDMWMAAPPGAYLLVHSDLW